MDALVLIVCQPLFGPVGLYSSLILRIDLLSKCSREAEFIRVALSLATLANTGNRVDADPANKTSSNGVMWG